MSNHMIANVRELNGYRVVYEPSNPAAMKSKNWAGYIYEHISVASRDIGRQLRPEEIVHHLDGNRANNRATNLLVIERSQHGKIHAWLRAGAPTTEKALHDDSSAKSYFGPPKFCKRCGITLQNKQQYYCSHGCLDLDTRRSDRPTPEQLSQDVQNMSIMAVSRLYGVSDNCIRKWLLKHGIENPKRRCLIHKNSQIDTGL